MELYSPAFESNLNYTFQGVAEKIGLKCTTQKLSILLFAAPSIRAGPGSRVGIASRPFG